MFWRTVVLIITICFLSSFLVPQLIGTKQDVIVQNTHEETAFERIQRTRTLRCGYIVSYLLRKDMKTGQLSGVAFDVVTQLAERLNLKLEWAYETGTATVAEDLKNGRFDMLCVPIGTNAPRGQVMDVSRPAFFSALYLYVRRDETRSSMDLSWVNTPKVSLSGIDGMSTVTLMMRLFPKAKIVMLPELSPVSDMFLQIASRKADATVMLVSDADSFLENNPGTIKAGSAKPIYVSPHSFWMPKGDVKLKGMMDVALDEMIYDGSMDRVLSMHEPEKGRYFLRAHPGYL